MNTETRQRHGFPADAPLEALKKDHHYVEQLFDRYLNTDNLQVKNESGQEILQVLEMHMILEETVFYPGVHAIDSALVDQCEQDHEQAKQLIAQLGGRDPGDSRCDDLFRQLSDAITQHVHREEQQLFPKIEQSGLDMNALGIEMQAFEANMVSQQARESAQSERRL